MTLNVTPHLARLARWAWLAALAPILLLASPAARVAEAAPPGFTAKTLDGAEVSLADLRGEVVLLNTWATWCHPCKAEMPYLQDLQDRFEPDGLRVVGVNIDAGDATGRVREFVDDLGVTFAIWRDPTNRFARTFRTSGVPETVLIGRNGEIVRSWKGEMGQDPAGDAAAIEAALAASPDETPSLPAAAAAIGLPVAFLAGLLSFLSPCVLPLVPTYAAILTGMSVKDLTATTGEARERARRAGLVHGLLFVAGFSAVFIAMGATATALGGLLQEHRVWISRIGGVVLALLGLHLLGLLPLPAADRDVRVNLAARPAGAAGTFLIGMAFGAGWTPCIGPALASILTLAAASGSTAQGVLLLAAYSLGLAIPFLMATLMLDRFMERSPRIRGWLPWLQRASGALILLLAVLLLTDSFSRLAALFA